MAATVASVSRPLVHYTIAELDALDLPDGVRYELVHGQLLVSKLGSLRHQRVAHRLATNLDGYIRASGPGEVVAPGAILVGDDSELQPDVLVFPSPRGRSPDWREVAAWWLVVEVLSPSNRDKDLIVKRDAYLEFGVHEIWFVDPIADTVSIVRPGVADVTLHSPDALRWQAPGAPGGVDIDLAELFADR
jgi:Uma2 family endonuclease